MISAAQSKLIRSLRTKKHRDQSRKYLVEGEKMIGELMVGKGGADHKITQLFATTKWIQRNLSLIHPLDIKVNEASDDELKKVSNLVTPQPVIGLVTLPDDKPDTETLLNHPVLAFESIRDPGNLGTIIRTADWFGIGQIVCTPDSADAFNPKVVQASMGAIARVKIYYMDIEQLLAEPGMKEKVVYGTFLEGYNIYEISLDKNPLILFGSESHGLSNKYDAYFNRKIVIPSFSRSGNVSESLNVAATVAVLCSELKRMG